MDKVYIDLDPGPFPGGDPDDLDNFGRPKNFPAMYEAVLRVEDWLRRRDVAHVTVFSGEGFNFHVFADSKIKHKADCLKRTHMWFDDQFDLHMDPQTKGDIARICRVYGTLNVDKGRWCTSLQEDEVYAGLDKIREIALQQRTTWHCIGHKRLSLKKWDVKIQHSVQLDFLSLNGGRVTATGEDVFQYLADEHGIYETIIPPCIKLLLKTPRLNWNERWALIVWLMDQMFEYEETVEVLRMVLAPDRFAHCVTMKGASAATRRKAKRCERQPQYLYRAREWGKEYYLSCGKLGELGWCVGLSKCATGGNLFP